MFGIDVSKYQSKIDWLTVEKNNPSVDFAFIKCSQGVGFTDAKFYENVIGVSATQIKWGAYHFATLNDYNVKTDAEAEAKYFTSVLKKAPTPSLPIVLDIEADSPKVQLDTFAVVDWIKTFFDTMTKEGYKDHILYSYTPFLNTHLPKGHDLGNIPLWIAAYTSKPVPILPIGWKDYSIWQYSDKGNVTGISTPVDVNKTIKPLY